MISLRFDRGSAVCNIEVGQSLAEMLSEFEIRPSFVISDKALALSRNKSFAALPQLELSGGEDLKTLGGISDVYEALLKADIDKQAHILIVGGGSLCDAAAFACSTYKRGVPFVLAPTTLLSQVDAAIGGKNALNFAGVKNVIGTITQPTHVLCASEFLKTLPATEISNGLAEMIKHGAIGSREYFEWLEQNVKLIRSLHEEALRSAILESIKIKVAVVEKDEIDGAHRAILNFGHTFGHAFEALSKISHGAAVSMGMVVAAKISIGLGLLREEEATRLKNLLVEAGLPIELPQLDKQELLKKISQDKKRRADLLNLVLLNRLGQAGITPLSLEKIGELLP